MVTDPASTNTTDAAFTINSWTSDDWSKMEAAGCVFLPAAGYRSGSSVLNAGLVGNYWSSSPHDSNAGYAYDVNFGSSYLIPAYGCYRYFDQSVRLVRPAE